jgi:uncharacterized protein YbjT (DUF2867 family)
MSKTALIIGATGLVGQQLTEQLLLDGNYQTVHVFVRNLIALPDNADPQNKLIQHIVDFNNMSNWQAKLVGDELFCCIGTTLKQAGSKLLQTKIDLKIPTEIARYARQNDVNKFILVSSANANPKSSSFYLQLKGQLEQNLIEQNWPQLVIVRPSFLSGKRSEFRLGEKVAIWLFSLLQFVPFIKRYKPITGEQLAKKMRLLANDHVQGETDITEVDKIVIKQLEQLF